MIRAKLVKSKLKKNKAFTLAEVLAVVAILAIITAVAIPATIYYRNSLEKTRHEDYAREVYFAAQTKALVMASSGELGRYVAAHGSDGALGQPLSDMPIDYPGGAAAWAKDAGYVYQAVYIPPVYDESGQMVSPASKTGILEKFLPKLSLDDEILVRGCYVVEYNIQNGSVYSAFYSDLSRGKADWLGEAMNKRYTYRSDGGDYFVGYYGGNVDKSKTMKSLKDLKLSVVNEEELVVIVDDPNYAIAGENITITVKGDISQKEKSFVLSNASLGGNINVTTELIPDGLRYKLVLDSITDRQKHFANVCPKADGFIPGENLTISAKAEAAGYSKTEAESVGCNSLFASLSGENANIACFRHLENLEPGVSGIVDDASSDSCLVKAAFVKNDLNFADYYLDKTIVGYLGSQMLDDKYNYRPVSNKALRTFAGAKDDDLAGEKQVIISNLVIISDTKNPTNVGLLGEFSGTISNIGVVSSLYYGSGDIGGLVGQLYGASNVSNCFSNVMIGNYSNGSTYGVLEGIMTSGGLIGAIYDASDAERTQNMYAGNNGLSASENATIITNCYSAGFTASGEYPQTQSLFNNLKFIEEYSRKRSVPWNFPSGSSDNEAMAKLRSSNIWVDQNDGNRYGMAGGLVGYINKMYGNVEIENCYSTCSVGIGEVYALNSSFGAGGGFVGEIAKKSNGSTNYSFKNCYSTGAINTRWTIWANNAFADTLFIGNFVGRVDKYDAVINHFLYQSTEIFYPSYNDARSIAEIKFDNCHYLNGSGISDGDKTWWGNQTSNSSRYYENKFNIDGLSLKEKDPANRVSASKTHPHDSFHVGDAYPYGNVTGLGHHYGDWPNTNHTATLVYYEIYANNAKNKAGAATANKVGFYSKELDIDTLLDFEKAENASWYVCLDGYALFSTTDEISCNAAGTGEKAYYDDLKSFVNDLNVVVGSVAVNGRSIYNKGNDIYIIDAKENGFNADKLVFVEKPTWYDPSSWFSKKEGEAAFKQGSKTYSIKMLKSNEVNDDLPKDSFYKKLHVALGANDDLQEIDFYYNPHIAKSIISRKTEIKEYKSSNANDKAIHIRSERQYALLSRDMNMNAVGNAAGNLAYFNLYKNLSIKLDNSLDFAPVSGYVCAYPGSGTVPLRFTGMTYALGQVAASAPVGFIYKTPVPFAKNTAYDYTTPTIDTYGVSNGFSGTFDGNSKIIANLTINEHENNAAIYPNICSAGLFGTTQGATIKNLVIENLTIIQTDLLLDKRPIANPLQESGAGLIVGQANINVTNANSTKINNVVIRGNNAIYGRSKVGGLVGSTTAIAVRDVSIGNGDPSTNVTNIKGRTEVGGIVGELNAAGACNFTSINANFINLQNEVTDTVGGNSYSNLYSTNNRHQGTGGFAGEIIDYGKRITLSTVGLNGVNVSTVQGTKDNGEFVSAGLFGGAYYMAATKNASLRCESVGISNSTLEVYHGGKNAEKSVYGALYGTLMGPETGNSTYHISPTDVGFINTRLYIKTTNNSGNLTVGGYVGYLQSNATLETNGRVADFENSVHETSVPAAFEKPIQITGRKTNNCTNYGPFVGLIEANSVYH